MSSTPSRRATRSSATTPSAATSAKASARKSKTYATVADATPVKIPSKASLGKTSPVKKSSMKKRDSSRTPSPKKSVSISKRASGRSRSATPSIKKRASKRAPVASDVDDDEESVDDSDTSAPATMQESKLSPVVGGSISRRKRSSSATAVDTRGEWPLPFDVIWLCAFSLAAFALAFGAIHPEETIKCFLAHEHVAGVLAVLLPFGSRWQIFMRCAIFFVIGAIPVRRWATNHLQETKVPAEVITAAVQGMIKLAIIQYFMFKQGEIDHQAAILHASLGFAVQDFVLNWCHVSSAANLQRFIEMAGNAVILFVPDDDVICKAMFYTLTVLSLSTVLRSLLVVASSRVAYKSFRRAVLFSDTVLVVIGVPFIAQYLLNNTDASSTAPLTVSSVMAPIACATVLFSSIILQHTDMLFN